MEQWQKLELAEAAATGIRAYLGTMRGANKFGAHATVAYNSEGSIEIVHGYGGEVTTLTFSGEAR